MSSQATLALLTALVIPLAGGCAAAVVEAEPALEAGTSDSGAFTAFVAGDSIQVQSNAEMGIWIRPTLRYQGFAGRPSVRCTAFDLDRDHFLAEQRTYETAIERGDWTHVPYGMEVQLPDDEIEDVAEMQNYAGDRMLLQCRADDDAGNSAVISYEMTLAVP